MNDMPNQSPLFAALARAQGEMSGALKDRQNPHFRSTYATLASVVDAIRAPLSKNGIAYTQRTSVEGRTVSVETVLLHGSGEQFSCGIMQAEAKDGSPQSIGSAHTYLRRYSLMSAFGVAPEDDDGESASRPTSRPEPRPEPKPEPKPRPAPVPEPEADTASAEHPTWAEDRGGFESALASLERDLADVTAWCEFKRRPAPAEMDREQRRKLLDYLRSIEGRKQFTDWYIKRQTAA